MKKSLKKIKILMLVDAWFPHVGGGQIHVWEISKRLADKGIQVTIYTRNLGIEDEKYPNINIFKVGHFKNFSNPLGRIEFLILALGHSLLNNYSLIHAHAFSPGMLVPIIKFFKKIPIVFTVHGQGDRIAGFPFLGNLLQDLVFYKIKYETLITVAKSTLTKKTVTPMVTVIPNGVNIEKFKVINKSRGKIKRILYVGRLSYEKGVDLLIKAFSQLNLANVQLNIVGEGDQLEGLKKISHGNIFFDGKLSGENLLKKFKEADLLVLPSRTEGQPLVLFEAWAAKLPILATRVGDNEYFIKDNINGFLCDASISSLADKLMLILKMDLRKVSENGWIKVQDYSWDKTTEKTLKVYKKII